MNGMKLVGAVAAAVLVLAAGTAVAARQDASAIAGGVSVLGGNETGEASDSDESLAGSSARRAADAALSTTGGGTVLQVERGDDPGAAYEVEIRGADGGVTEVLLDDRFDPIGRETDD